MGAEPSRPKFRTKTEAIEAAKVILERWLNRDSDDECAVTKTNITVGQCFKNFLAMIISGQASTDVLRCHGLRQSDN